MAIKLENSQSSSKVENSSPCLAAAPQLKLFPLSGKRIEASFSGARISSDGGLLLLRELENQLGLLSKFAQTQSDNRHQSYVRHSMEELLVQRVFQIAAGYEDVNDSKELSSDHVMKLCAGRLPQSDDLGSASTMCRFENAVSRSDLYRIAEVFLDHFVGSYGNQAPRVIVLDCDDTNHNCHGNQQQCLFNTYYKEHCLMPLLRRIYVIHSNRIQDVF